MRYIFYVLLFSNFAYLVYHLAAPVSQTPAPTRAQNAEGAETIFLLRENDNNDNREQEVNQVINNPVRQNAPGRQSCLAVGPFPDVFTGRSVLDQLTAVDINGELRAVDHSTGDNDYRVMIPPASSLQDAFRKLRELKSRKVDSYVITQGPDALAISLGVFSTRAAAEKMMDQRAREGHEATIVAIPRLQREFWIFGEENQQLAIEPALWESLVARIASLEQRLMACPADPSG